MDPFIAVLMKINHLSSLQRMIMPQSCVAVENYKQNIWKTENRMKYHGCVQMGTVSYRADVQ